jgi:hypothetical protein
MIVVERAQDHAPLIMLGFLAVGGEASLKALQSAAISVDLENGRTSNNRNEIEVMVLFRPGSSRSSSLDLYHDAQAGKFGALRLEVILVPLPATGQGVDLDRDASAEPPSYISDPRN